MQTPFTLYHLDYCPYCIRVRRAAARLDLALNLVDIGEHPDARALLLAERGRATVPVLHIPDSDGGRLLGESADIITFLDAWAAQQDAAA